MEKMIKGSQIEGNIDRDKPDEEYFLFGENLSISEILAENNNWKQDNLLSSAEKKKLLSKSEAAEHSFCKYLKKGIRQNSFLDSKSTFKWIFLVSVIFSIIIEIYFMFNGKEIEKSLILLEIAQNTFLFGVSFLISISIERMIKKTIGSANTARKLEKSFDVIKRKLTQVDGYHFDQINRVVIENSIDQYFGEDTYYEIKIDSLSRKNI